MSKQVPKVDLAPVVQRMKQKFPSTNDQLIPLLQFAQAEIGYLPAEAMNAIAEYLRVPPAHVFGVATFYAQFRFKPLGKNRITVCRGTACHVRGSGRLVEELERELKIKAGNTTEDLKFSLETVACLGSCALAPMVVVNNKVHGKVTAKKLMGILAELDGRAPAKAEVAEEKPAEKVEQKKKEEKKVEAKKPAARPVTKAAKKPAAKKPVKKSAKKTAGKNKKKAVKKTAGRKAGRNSVKKTRSARKR